MTQEEERAQTIDRDWGGIYAPHEAFYIYSMIYSAERSREAFLKFDAVRNEPANASTLFGCVQEGIIHSAALSRFFWPPRNNHKRAVQSLHEARATKLRQAFSMTDDSSLRFRGARDALDHFEERLDLFLLDQPSGTFYPLPMIGTCELADFPARHIFKLIDPASQKAIILGQVYDFAKIRAEVDRILSLAGRFATNGARLRNGVASA